jgi:hypothetical protein
MPMVIITDLIAKPEYDPKEYVLRVVVNPDVFEENVDNNIAEAGV